MLYELLVAYLVGFRSLNLVLSRSNCQRLKMECTMAMAGERRNPIVAGGCDGFLLVRKHVLCVRDNREQATVRAEQSAVADSTRRRLSVDD